MINSDLLSKLKSRYASLHPLIFLRSVERAKTAGDAFDILDTFPEHYPVVWDEASRRWSHTDDMLGARRFKDRETEPPESSA